MEASVVALLLPSCFFALYLILESADWGLCLAAPLVCRNREENQAVLSLLRPGLDGNELWFFMGFFMLSLSLSDIEGSGMHAWYMTMLSLVGVGALLRIAAVVLTKLFSSPLMMKGLCVFSLISLILTGMLGTYILMPEGGLISGTGIFCAVWTVLACFQIGALYGAVKVVNPLGERFRAACLVSSCLSAVFYIIFAVSLRLALGGGICFFFLRTGDLLLRLCHGDSPRLSHRYRGAEGGHGRGARNSLPRGRGCLEPGGIRVAAVPKESRLPVERYDLRRNYGRII